MTDAEIGRAMTDIDEDDLGELATEIANAIEDACAGHDIAACYLAISMVLGEAAARAEPPDFKALMERIRRNARAIYDSAHTRRLPQ